MLGATFALRSFFSGDDYLNLALAREMGLTWAYLVRTVFGHFVPGYRLTVWALLRWFPYNYAASEGLLIALWLGSVAAVYRLLRFLFGATWTVVLLTVFFAVSLVQLPNLLWLASGLHFVSTTLFGVLCLDGYLRFRLTHRRQYAVQSVVAFTIGALFLDAMIVFPALAVLFAVLILPADRSVRGALHSVLGSWPIWLGFAVPEGVLLGYRLTHASAYAGPRLAGPKAILKFMGVSWSQALGPAIIGLDDPHRLLVGSQVATIVAGQTVLAIAIVASIVRSPRAWRPWAIFGFSFLATTIAVGAERVTVFGPGLGHDYRYLSYLPFVLTLAAAFAWLPCERLAVPIVGVAIRRHAVRRRRGPAVQLGLSALAVLVVAGYLGNDWLSARTYERNVGGYTARQYIDKYFASVAAARRTDPNVEIYNEEIPLVSPAFYPYNQASRTIGYLDRRVRFNPPSAGYVIGQDGTIHAARFVAQESLVSSAADGCIGPASQTVAEVLTGAQALASGPWFLRFSYESPSGAKIVIDGDDLTVPSGSGVIVENLTPGPAHQIAIYVAAGGSLCVNNAVFGQPQPVS